MGLWGGRTTIECALERRGRSAMVGEVLGRYRIVEEIGAGGMGVVFRARDQRLGRDLALKVLSPGVLHDEVSRKRFRNVALMLSRLNHPSIQVIHDFDTQDGVDFLVSELVPGVTLVDKLRAGLLAENQIVDLGLRTYASRRTDS